MNEIQRYNKAIVPLVVTVLLGGLSYVNVFGEMTVEQALTGLVTAFFVYLIPNRK